MKLSRNYMILSFLLSRYNITVSYKNVKLSLNYDKYFRIQAG